MASKAPSMHTVEIKMVQTFRTSCNTCGWTGPVRTDPDEALSDREGHWDDNPVGALDEATPSSS